MKIEEKVKALLAEQIGVEKEDIHEGDHLVEDLHMSPSDLSDFFALLDNEGINVAKINIEDVETVEDLLESINSQEI